jgi:hypothetical protein
MTHPTHRNDTHDRLEKLVRRLTYANVMSTLAVFAVLAGGGAWAASRIGTGSIKNGAVTTNKLHNRAVTTAKLAANAVTTANLAANAVTTANLAANAVTTANLAANAVTTANLAANAVTTANLAANAVTTANLAANAVTRGKLADATINDAKIESFSLRLHDWGGQTNNGSAVVESTTSVPPGACVPFDLDHLNPAPSGVIGSLVVGYLTDSHGHAVLETTAWWFRPWSARPLSAARSPTSWSAEARLRRFLPDRCSTTTSSAHSNSSLSSTTNRLRAPDHTQTHGGVTRERDTVGCHEMQMSTCRIDDVYIIDPTASDHSHCRISSQTRHHERRRPLGGAVRAL